MSEPRVVTAAIERLYRRIMLMVGRGRVTTGDDSGPVQFLQVRLGADEVRDRTPRLAEYGFTSMPPVGSDTVEVFIGGDRANGVIIATGNQIYRLVGLASGDAALYDSRGASIWLTPSGPVVNGGGMEVKITNTPIVRMETAALKVTGDIVDNCDTNTRSMAGMRTVYNGHTHNDPQGGATGVPNQLE